MIWLILQMLTCLTLAAMLGILLGWWMRGLRVDEARRVTESEWERRLGEYKERLDSCRAEGQTLAERLAGCERRSVELARRLAAALAAHEPETSAGVGSGPPAALPLARPGSPERWFVAGEGPTKAGGS